MAETVDLRLFLGAKRIDEKHHAAILIEIGIEDDLHIVVAGRAVAVAQLGGADQIGARVVAAHRDINILVVKGKSDTGHFRGRFAEVGFALPEIALPGCVGPSLIGELAVDYGPLCGARALERDRVLRIRNGLCCEKYQYQD